MPVYKTLAATPGKNGVDVSRRDITSGDGNWKIQQDWSLH
jgi:hypothetical protein